MSTSVKYNRATLPSQFLVPPRRAVDDPDSLATACYHPRNWIGANTLQKAMTDEELGAEYVRAMGSDLGQLCGELRDDVDWLRRKWSNFQELFGKGQEGIDLLNRAASHSFYFLHRLFFEDHLLH